MAKKVTGMIKLQLPAGKATPAPPVGPALGQHGVNIMGFCKEFNAKTADKAGLIIPVVITVSRQIIQLHIKNSTSCSSYKERIRLRKWIRCSKQN